MPQQRQIQDCLRRPPGVLHIERQEQDADRRQRHAPREWNSRSTQGAEAASDRNDSQGGQHEAGAIEGSSWRVGLLRHKNEGKDERTKADRSIDQEQKTPVEECRDVSREQWPDNESKGR